jgi:hypothetical protein
MVDMHDLATFGIDTEDIYGLAKFFRLKYDSLENLRNIKPQCIWLWRESSTFALPSTSTIAK